MQIRVRPGRRELVPLLFLAALAVSPPLLRAQTPEKLLLSQVEARGDVAQYIAIKNTGPATVDLSRYYLTDATATAVQWFYYNLPDSMLPIGGGQFEDFVARFPDGATIAPGESLSVSITGSEDFSAAYGQQPHFELYEDNPSPDSVPDMVPARPNSIVSGGNPPPKLAESGEVAIFFFWDGATDLVTDIDYVVWGDKAEAVDKTGVTILSSTYNADTPISSQEALDIFGATSTFVRTDDAEGTQTSTGSNGVGGRDETSENLTGTFSIQQGVPPGVTPPDTTGPALVSAVGDGGMDTVRVVFSEVVGTGGDVAGNYEVFPTGDPGSPISVNTAGPSGSQVTLSLADTLTGGVAYTVRVNNVQDLAGNPIEPNSTVAFVATGGSGFRVTGVFQFGADYVGVGFSEPVNETEATQVSNYSFNPPLSIASVRMQGNGQTAILQMDSNLPSSTSYQATVSGITSATGDPLTSSGPFPMTTVAETVTNINEIHENYPGDGVTRTVMGQVYFPVNSRMGTPSGYIQDGSGRGMNIFGDGTGQPAVDALGNVAKVTGTTFIFSGTTVELENYTAELIVSDQPLLEPTVLTTQEANSSQWEGTYIQTTGVVGSISRNAGGADNFVVNDGSGNFTIRVDLDLGIDLPGVTVGATVTGRGAGSNFSGTFQMLVGNAADFFEVADTTPPTLVSATGRGGETLVQVEFSEPVGTGADNTTNYEVFPTADPGSPVTVIGASVDLSTVTLTLAVSLTTDVGYTVRVNNVQDLAGNPIAPNSTVAFTAIPPLAFEVTGVFQFGANYVGVGFSKEVNRVEATTISNYTFSPPLEISSIEIQANGQTSVLQTASDLPQSSTYSVGVSGITSSTGDALTSTGPFAMTTVNGTVMNIRELQENWPDDGTGVAVIGQVYIPAFSRGSTANAYIQDGSNRGINVFGSQGTGSSLIDVIGNVVYVVGDALIYFTTREIENYTITPVADTQPPLGAIGLTNSGASDPTWEGTYIESSGELVNINDTGSATNYDIVDGTGSLTIRIDNDLNVPSVSVGDRVTGRGAGSQFQTTFQIMVGNGFDFFLNVGPPTVTAAEGDGGSNKVAVFFSEDVLNGANDPNNYQVFESANPANMLGVTQADAAGSRVDLTLGASLVVNTRYTVAVENVEDADGNPVPPGSSIEFVALENKGRLFVPARTLIKSLEEIQIDVDVRVQDGSTVQLRIFNLQGTMVRSLIDRSFGGAQRYKESVLWDARDETFEYVRAGMYVCQLQVAELNGTVQEDEAPIVVAVRLD